MSLTDVLMVTATALSPLIAVQVSQYLAAKREGRNHKLWIFKTLMATRAQSLSPLHVQALNSIDLEFSSKDKREKPVLDAWAQYLDHLSNDKLSAEAWTEKRLELLVDLIYAMGLALGYTFNKTQIKNGVYSPVAHSKLENEQEQVRLLLLEVLNGTRPIPLRVTELPA